METMKIECRRAATLPAYRPKGRTLDRARIRAVVKYVALTAAGIAAEEKTVREMRATEAEPQHGEFEGLF